MKEYRMEHLIHKSGCQSKKKIGHVRKNNDGGNSSEEEREELEQDSERQVNLIQQRSPSELSQDLETLDESMFSDDIEAMCKVECNMCKKPVTTMRNHAQKHHEMSIREFRKLHPEEVFAVKTYHR